jgi:hypothetical protein
MVGTARLALGVITSWVQLLIVLFRNDEFVLRGAEFLSYGGIEPSILRRMTLQEGDCAFKVSI